MGSKFCCLDIATTHVGPGRERFEKDNFQSSQKNTTRLSHSLLNIIPFFPVVTLIKLKNIQICLKSVVQTKTQNSFDQALKTLQKTKNTTRDAKSIIAKYPPSARCSYLAAFSKARDWLDLARFSRILCTGTLLYALYCIYRFLSCGYTRK